MGPLLRFVTILLTLGVPSSAFAKDSAFPFYASSKPAVIQVSEEGEEGTFPRQGVEPVGAASGFLAAPSAAVVATWMKTLCAALKTPKDVHFPTGDWTDGAPKDCRKGQATAAWIKSGAFADTGVLQVTWPSRTKPKKQTGRTVLALVGTDAAQKPTQVLKIIGALNVDAGDMSGTPVLEFATSSEIVTRFDGYVSAWQIVLKKTPKGVTVEELR